MSRFSSASRAVGTGSRSVRTEAATVATVAPLSSGSSAIAPDADAERPECSPDATAEPYREIRESGARYTGFMHRGQAGPRQGSRWVFRRRRALRSAALAWALAR